MRAANLLYPVLILAIGVASWSVAGRSGGPAPLRAAPPVPDSAEVHGLFVAAAAGLPPWRAELARPRGAGHVFSIGGAIGGLDLEQVVVTLKPPSEPGEEALRIASPGGVLGGGSLSLTGGVSVTLGSERLLAAGRMELSDDTARFPEVVVLWPGSVRERTARDLDYSLAELARLLSNR